MPTYSWLTWSAAKSALAGRLNDPTKRFWPDAELAIHLSESLRTWNALTESWKAEFTFTPTVSGGTAWQNLATLAGNPRLRTVTDADLYTSMQYALLEPPTGAATWTGTTQFSLTQFQQALYRRCQEVIQAFNCNNALIPLPSTPGVTRAQFPDNVLEPQRVRFIPADLTTESINTLTREDEYAFDAFETQHGQNPGPPQSWSLISEPPLAMDTDVPPNTAGSFDAVVLQSGVAFAPPASTLLGIPDDWTWVARWGALADLLGRESESTDRMRAAYCFPPGTKITMADMSLKAIQDIAVGDEVFTHAGNVSKVSHLLPSTAKTQVVTLHSCAFGEVTATKEHPFWVMPVKWGRGRDARMDLTPPRWVEAGHVEEGDLVLCPIPEISDEKKSSRDHGWLLGIYLAEGSVAMSRPGLAPKSVSFELHIDEAKFAQRITNICKLADRNCTTYVYKRSWANSFTLRINSKKVASWLLSQGGKGAKTKSINKSVFARGENFARGVLRGWCDGDGHLSLNPVPTLRAATASEALARQMQMLAAAVGVTSSFSKCERQTNIAWQEIWYVKFAGDAAIAITEERPQEKYHPQSRIFIRDGYLCSYVTSARQSTHAGSLFNFSVEGDNSYIAEGVAVHNCLQRYTDGLKMVKGANWLTDADIAGQPAEIVSLLDQDSFSPEWEVTGTNWPTIVVGGTDFFSPSPITAPSVGMTVIGNMPIPASDADYVQVSRDVFQIILGMAQHLAAFKMGGQSFASTRPMLDDFMRAAAATNKRIAQLGLNFDAINSEGKAQEIAEPRE